MKVLPSTAEAQAIASRMGSPAPFIEGGKDEEPATPVEGGQLAIGYEAGEQQLIAMDPEAPRQALQVPPHIGGELVGDDELVSLAQSLGYLRVGLDQAGDVLAPVAPADVEGESSQIPGNCRSRIFAASSRVVTIEAIWTEVPASITVIRF